MRNEMNIAQEITGRYVLPTIEEKTSYGYKRLDPYTKLFEERIIFASFANSSGHGLIVNGKAKGWVIFSTQPVRLQMNQIKAL